MRQIEGSPCPKCGSFLDGASAVDSNEVIPKEGDYSVCLKCGAMLKFGENLKLELLTEAEIEEFRKNYSDQYKVFDMVGQWFDMHKKWRKLHERG